MHNKETIACIADSITHHALRRFGQVELLFRNRRRDSNDRSWRGRGWEGRRNRRDFEWRRWTWRNRRETRGRPSIWQVRVLQDCNTSFIFIYCSIAKNDVHFSLFADFLQFIHYNCSMFSKNHPATLVLQYPTVLYILSYRTCILPCDLLLL